MPEDKVTINFGGRRAEASLVEVNQSNERWNEYLLEDGSSMKVKLILKKVLRVDGQYDAEGNPIYVLQSTNISTVNSPKHIRRPRTP